MADLTYNQGIHGAQDNANAILRNGITCPIWSGDWKSDSFKDFFEDWADTAKTISELKDLRIAAFGRMRGMQDILINPGSIMRQLGPQISQENIGKIYSIMQDISEKEIEKVIENNSKNFEIDSDLGKEQHKYAAKFQAAVNKFLKNNDYEAFTINFQAVSEDGRFKQLPLMAASNLMAEGYGYGAEGDVCAAIIVKMGHLLSSDAHFAEMYAMDFERDSVLISHMGEGNWKISEKNKKPELIDRELSIGGLENPPTIKFRAEPGTATIASLAPIQNNDFRLVVSKGEIIETPEAENIEMPYFHFRPSSGVKEFATEWLENGGTHHQCLTLGDDRRKWKLLCKHLDIEYAEV